MTIAIRARQSGIDIVHEQTRLAQRSYFHSWLDECRIARNPWAGPEAPRTAAIIHAWRCRKVFFKALGVGLARAPDSRVEGLAEVALDVLENLGAQLAGLAFERDRARSRSRTRSLDKLLKYDPTKAKRVVAGEAT
ncbi:MAG: hypothetical protein EOP82_07450 [Variovorax sp.]|nr:MAG: hypothetical protein EOP82_07450 [Variovorax sp.]